MGRAEVRYSSSCGRLQCRRGMEIIHHVDVAEILKDRGRWQSREVAIPHRQGSFRSLYRPGHETDHYGLTLSVSVQLIAG